MEEARRLAASGYPEGTVVAADRQTAGRGRFRNRTWTSEPGQDLTFTAILPSRYGSLPGLPLRIGLALHRAVEEYAQGIGCSLRDTLAIKWPNDLLAGGRKISGLLCESSAGRYYVGIGVNCGNPGDGSFRTPASGLAEVLGTTPDRFRLLERFLDKLFQLPDEADWRTEVTRRLWLAGSRAKFRTGLSDPGAPGARVIEGIVRSVGDSGELILDTTDGPLALVSGEVSSL